MSTVDSIKTSYIEPELKRNSRDPTDLFFPFSFFLGYFVVPDDIDTASG